MRRILTSWFSSRRIADLEREVRTLTGERDDARADRDRVTQQRDELRRVIGNVRSYARQEALRVCEDHVHLPAKLAAPVDPGRVAMRPIVALAAHLDDQRPPDLTACYHPAQDSSSEAFWHRCHGTHDPCPPGGHDRHAGWCTGCHGCSECKPL